jgi:hypothetical protein
MERKWKEVLRILCLTLSIKLTFDVVLKRFETHSVNAALIAGAFL